MKKAGKKQNSIYESSLSQREQIYKKGAKQIVGIDIGSSFIKIVKMKKHNKIGDLLIEPIPSGLMANGRIIAEELLSDVLNQIRVKYKISGDCAVCVSANEVIVRELNIPEMGEEQILDNIKHEITSFLPFDYSEYSIDYKVLEYNKKEEDGVGSLRLMVAAIPKKLARSYVDTLKRAKLKVKYMDVVPNIDSKLARLVLHAIGNDELQDIAIIDFGSHTTNVTIMNKGNYSVHKTISNGGEYLSSIIAEKMNMEFSDAEVYKLQANFFDPGDETQVTQHVINFYDYLILDIDRVLEFYRNRNGHKAVDQIYVMGGGSMMKGLSGYLERRLGVKVFHLSEALEMFRGGRNQTEYLATLFHAIGATMREE